MSKKRIKLKKNEIKYNINNTDLPVIITHDGKVYFDIDAEDEAALLNKNEEKIREYKEKVSRSMEYIMLEGFLSESMDN